MSTRTDGSATTKSSSPHCLSSDSDNKSSITDLTNTNETGIPLREPTTGNTEQASQQHLYNVATEKHARSSHTVTKQYPEFANDGRAANSSPDIQRPDSVVASNRVSRVPPDHPSVLSRLSALDLDRAVRALAESPILQMHVRRQWWDEDLTILLQETAINRISLPMPAAVAENTNPHGFSPENPGPASPPLQAHPSWPPTITVSDPHISGSPLLYTNSTTPTKQQGHCTFQTLPYGTSSASTLQIIPASSNKPSSSSAPPDQQQQTARVQHSMIHAIIPRKSPRNQISLPSTSSSPMLLLTLETDITETFTEVVAKADVATSETERNGLLSYLLSFLTRLREAEAKFLVLQATGPRVKSGNRKRIRGGMCVPWISRGMERWFDENDDNRDDDLYEGTEREDGVCLGKGASQTRRRWREALITAVARRWADEVASSATRASQALGCMTNEDDAAEGMKLDGIHFDVELPSLGSLSQWREEPSWVRVRCVGLYDRVVDEREDGDEAAWLCFVD